MEQAFNIDTLIHNFEKSPPKNEENTRISFIDPFFTLLGWDVRNDRGEIEAYRDVLVEEQVNKKYAGRVDYAFKLKRTRKFFVEAKKPSVCIKGEDSPACQIREYGWWGKLSICVLTDFEEFAVYNTRYKPKESDTADKHRLRYFRYNEYLENWDFFQNYFSKQAVEEGSLEKLADADKNKEKIVTVDTAFLAEIEEWRKALASNIALQNRDSKNRSILNLFDLNLAVQTIIDRIIFLKFAESRGMEAPEQLEGLEKTTGIYAHLDKLSLQADKKYNSGLFKRDDDRKFITELNVSDAPLKKILKFLEASSYGFQVLPIEILGSIYERFLGKTIYFTKEERAKIEEKPETRKAGGVYYTPEYIVSYIVDNTLGELLKNKKPQEVEKIRVLDPACGSGSFLVNAYDKLLSWHLEYYSQSKNTTKALKEKKIYEVKRQKNKTYKLSITEKQHILLNNIYGVDIDRQAVEVSKLSLLLKLMEDENVESEEELFKHSDVQMLPDLANNIKCGNSLIGSDFYKEKQKSLFPIKERFKINAFDWEGEEGFAEIMQAGGFDVVIGNPPYVRNENLEKFVIDYAKNCFECASGFFDIFQLFIEKAFNVVTLKGCLSFIIPSLFLKGMNYQMSRKLLLEQSNIKIIRDYGDSVFTGVQMPTCVIAISKNKSKSSFVEYHVRGKNDQFKKLKLKQSYFNNQDYVYSYDPISSKVKKYTKLKNLVSITRGLEIGKDQKTRQGVSIIFGEDAKRYSITSISFIPQKTYQAFKKEKSIFANSKIVIRETGKRITATFDETGLATSRSLYCIRSSKISLIYLLGIINSTLLQYFYKNEFMANTDIFPKIRIGQVRELPIKELDLSNPTQKAQHDRMVQLVDQMLATQKKLHAATSPSEKALYQKDTDDLDRKIDALVYELYGLTEEEITIVEGSG